MFKARTDVCKESVIDNQTAVARVIAEDLYTDMACKEELRTQDLHTGIQYRNCTIDYTQCPAKRCIKKLS